MSVPALVRLARGLRVRPGELLERMYDGASGTCSDRARPKAKNGRR